MKTKPQISANIAQNTKKALKQCVEAYGLKEGYLVEMALPHHLQVPEELPADIVISSKMVVSSNSFNQVTEQIENPKAPTQVMKELFENDGL